MKKIIVLIFLTCFGFQNFAQQLFQKYYYVSGNNFNQQFESADSIKTGGFVLSSSFTTKNWLRNEIFLARLKPNGDSVWTRMLSGPWSISFNSVKSTRDDGFLIYCTLTDTINSGKVEQLVIKTDQDGKVKWNYTYGKGNAFSFSQTIDGGYILLGNQGDTINYGTLKVIKIDSIGNIQWARLIQNSSPFYGGEISENPSGYIIRGEVTSESSIICKINKIGDVLWEKFWNGFILEKESMNLDPKGNIILVGSIASLNSKGVFLSKMDTNGNPLWSKTYEYGSNTYGISVRPTLDNGYAFVSNNGSYFLFAKTDSLGNLLWTKKMESDKQSGFWAETLIPTSDGGFGIEVDYSYGLLFMKTDSLGNSSCASSNFSNPITNSLSTIPVNISLSAINYSEVKKPAIINSKSRAFNLDSLCHSTGFSLDKNHPKPTPDFPNPFSAYTILEFNYPVSDGLLLIYNSLGQLVSSSIHFSGNHFRLERGNLSEGIYFYKVFEKNEVKKTGKLLIKE